MKYRCVFYNPNKDKRIKWDIDALSTDDALSKGARYAKENDLFYRGYKDLTVEEIPNGLSRIGIKFRAFDTALKKEFSNYLFILAKDEKDAAEQYYDKYYGKTFWFKPMKIESNGKNVYGKILETYFM